MDRLRYIYIFLLLLIPALCQGTTYYVCDTQNDCNSGTGSPSGWGAPSDANNGTSKSTPWQIPENKVASLSSNDTLIFGNGNYTDDDSSGHIIYWGSGGGAGGTYVTLQAENQHGAVIDGESYTTDIGIFIDQGIDYIKIEGFKFYQTLKKGISLGSNGSDGTEYIQVTKSWFNDIGRTTYTGALGYNGIYADAYSRYVTIDRSIFEDIGRTSSGCGDCYKHDHAIYLRGWGHLITNSIFINIPRGWHLSLRGYLGTGPGAVFSHKVINNTFDDVTNDDPTYDKQHINIYTQVSDNDPEDILVQNNIFGDEETGTAAIINITGSAAGDFYIYNNVAATTTLMNSGDQAKCDSYTTSGNSTGNATSSYNVTDWDNDDFTLTESATLMIDQGREANAPALDYIDTPRPQGSADDIGAYEYQQSANPIDGMLIQ